MDYLSFVNICEYCYHRANILPICILFMKTILQQHKKEIHNVETNQKKQNESDEVRINEILSRYFIWFMNNNVEEYQMFFKFWNQKFMNQSSVLLK